MKKKFVLTLALVLMVAVTLSAATPIEVSGSFEFKYNFEFGDGAGAHSKANGAKYSTFVSVATDYWKVSLGKDNKDDALFADKYATNATAEVYLDKALADEGVDMGDVSLTLHLGAGPGAPSVFADAADFEAALPGATNDIGLTIGYADLVKVFVATSAIADPFDAMIGASFAPVDGVEAAVAYGVAEKSVAVSAAADIAALADLDFDLAASVLYVGDFGTKTNNIFADVAGELEGVGLYVGFQALNLKQFGIRAGASYGTEVEGVKLAANVDFAMDDFDDTDDYSVDLGASAAYEMGTVTYKLAIGYALADKKFTVTPTVGFSW